MEVIRQTFHPARYPKEHVYSKRSLFLYKVIVTLDTPLQLLAAALQYVGRRLGGRKAKAAKSLLATRGLVHFLRHSLPRFWRA